MRFVPSVRRFPLLCFSQQCLLLLGCGGDPSDSGDAEATTESQSTGPHFAVEGRGETERLSAVLDVVEGDEAPRLAITGFDADENLIAIYATFDGTDSVVGSHVLPIGPVAAEVFAVGTIDGRAYQSLSGELRVSMSSDWHSEGEFEVTLALDEASPLMLPPGAPVPAAPAAAELTLVGTFASEWRVNCHSYISGFTGGHAVSDSPYCNALTF
jgi:hypothetical protein